MPLTLTTAGSFVCSLLAAWVASHSLVTPIHVIGTWAQLRLTQNPGIAFGLRIPSPYQEILILCALALVLWAALKATTRLAHVGFGLILGGALANLVDRFMDGFVTDYFAVGTFPVFNVADSCITIGVVLLLVESSGIVSRMQRNR